MSRRRRQAQIISQNVGTCQALSEQAEGLSVLVTFAHTQLIFWSRWKLQGIIRLEDRDRHADGGAAGICILSRKSRRWCEDAITQLSATNQDLAATIL